ncbi:hypothetical protein [Streptomyces sp. NPDC030920]
MITYSVWDIAPAWRGQLTVGGTSSCRWYAPDQTLLAALALLYTTS